MGAGAGIGATAPLSGAPAAALRKADWAQPAERIRTHVREGRVSEAVSEDLGALFAALGLGGLTLPSGKVIGASSGNAVLPGNPATHTEAPGGGDSPPSDEEC